MKNKEKNEIPSELLEKLQKLEKEREEFLEGWKRAKADLINSKRDMADVLGKYGEKAEIRVLEDILPVMDALSEAERVNIEGLVPIKKLLDSILKDKHIKEICPKEGEEFDPKYHEAVSGEGDIVYKCIQNGYMYKSHVIRPAKVAVKVK